MCENPSFIGALNAFRSNGAKTVGVPLRDDGIDVDELEKVLATTENVKLLYLIPTFQNPAGITSTLENRKKVYELAKKYSVVILEDNPYGDFVSRRGRSDLQSFDTEEALVVYCS